MNRKVSQSHRGVAFGLIAVAVSVSFLLPLLPLRLSPTVWYPYTSSPSGFASFAHKYLGYGAVFWSPNHYWIYFGSNAVQLTNSSASEITVNSVDENGTTIFGYYTTSQTLEARCSPQGTRK